METPPPAPQQPAAQQQTGFYAGIRRIGLWRSDDHWFGGVAGGLAERLGVDALIVRGIFVVTVLLGGVGLLAYGIGWLLLPRRSDGRILLEEVLAGRFDFAFLGALAFTIVGLSRGGGWLVGWPGMPGGLRAVGGLLWLGVLAVVVAAVVAAVAGKRSDGAPRAGGTPGGTPAPGTSTGAPGSSTASGWSSAAPAQQPYGAPAHTTGWGTATSAAAAPTPPTTSYPATAYSTTSYPTTTYPTTTYPTGTYPAPPAPGPAPVPPAGRYSQPTVAKPPRKPRPSGPGVATLGAVVALSLLTLAGLLVAHRTGHFDGPIVLTALGVAIVLAGLGIVVSGLRGRTSGVLGFLAILGLLASVPLGIVARSDWSSGGARHAVAYDVAPVTRTVAERGWSFGVGDSTVDLTGVPLTDEPLTVPVSLGAGDLTIIVPSSGAKVVADVQLGVGTIKWDVGDGSPRQVDGGTLHETFSSLSGGETHRIHLRVSAGAGDVVIEQEQP